MSFAPVLCACSVLLDEPQSRDFYSDKEVEAFVEQFPSLASEYAEEPTPPDILQQLEIEVEALRPVDRYIGDCLDFVVYNLSPSYELVLDDNACSGFHVYVRLK